MSDCVDFEVKARASRNTNKNEWDIIVEPATHDNVEASLHFHNELGLVLEGVCTKQTIPENYVSREFYVRIPLSELNDAINDELDDGALCRFRIERLSEIKDSVQIIVETLWQLLGITGDSQVVSPRLIGIKEDAVEFIRIVTNLSGAYGVSEIDEL